MAITQTTVVPKRALGPGLSASIIRITFDTSYPTGGESITVTDFSAVYGAKVIGGTQIADNGYSVQAVVTSGGTSIALSVYQNYDPAGSGSSDRPDIEYPNGTDLVANLAGPINVLVFGK